MMKLLVFFALLGLTLAKVDYSGYRVFRAYPTAERYQTLALLKEKYGLDFWSDYRFEGDYLDFMVSPPLRDIMELTMHDSGIRYETFIEDVEVAALAQISSRNDQAIFAGDFDYNVYHNFTEIQKWIKDFAAANSAYVTQTTLGKSLEGRNMGAIKISTGSGRKAFVIDCGIHAREWIGPATCMHTAKMLINNYTPGNNNIMDSVDFYIIPISNPDGYEFTWTTNRMWRKTRKPLGNCFGVDPNRNWNVHWDNPVDGASDEPCDDSYRGPKPASEIEIQNQRDFVLGIENVAAYIDVHSYGQLWMYPFGYTTAESADEALLNKIAQDSANAIAAVHGKTFKYGSIANIIYVATGSTADYFYSKGTVCSFGAELRDTGRYGFLLPASEIQPAAEETFAGLMKIAEAVADGRCPPRPNST